LVRRLQKKSKRFSARARKAGIGHLNPELWKLEKEVSMIEKTLFSIEEQEEHDEEM